MENLNVKNIKYRNLLRNNSLRTTGLRLSLLDYLTTHHGPFTVRELYDGLDHSCNLTTIYRSIELFVEKNIAVQCNFDDGLNRYELCCSHDSHHHHLICKSCRRWIKVDACLQAESLHDLKKTGFTKITHKLEFFGICPQCSSEKPKLTEHSPSVKNFPSSH